MEVKQQEVGVAVEHFRVLEGLEGTLSLSSERLGGLEWLKSPRLKL